jgi:hypothetical protein
MVSVMHSAYLGMKASGKYTDKHRAGLAPNYPGKPYMWPLESMAPEIGNTLDQNLEKTLCERE